MNTYGINMLQNYPAFYTTTIIYVTITVINVS